eukprot:gene2739-2778_t
MADRATFKPYQGPAGGWGSVRSLAHILGHEGVAASGPLALARQNKPDGFQCVSCAWAKPANPHPFEFCENGAKATAWELTSRTCGPEFFARHTVTELRKLDDYHLEKPGRLTHPMRYDAETDRYVPVSWDHAIAEIGREMRALPDRKAAVFYSSGRMSNEASFMLGLLARAYGNNNLPDSSNMCHETTSVALPASIGVPVGTVTLEDFAETGMFFFFGQNVGSNSPRMLHQLQDARRRGVPIIAFNPLRERGLESFTNPQSPVEMLTGEQTRISTAYHQVRAGGDLAALTGLCKVLLELAEANPDLLDARFIAEHTSGFYRLRAFVEAQDWPGIERESGLTRAALEATARTYAAAKSCIAVYGMGLTQHRAGVATVQMLVNLLLLHGNIGKPGAGICPVRGHSNVQGQRTVGITEKVALLPVENLEARFGFEIPKADGLNTVEACEGVLDGTVRAFIGFGGNFARAIPDAGQMEPAWRRLRLTVNIATKLNRTHLLPGAISYLLPVSGRTEIDETAFGPQTMSMEDSLGSIHSSRGIRAPIADTLLSEPALLARLATAMLDPNPKLEWQAWSQDLRKIRTAIADVYPEIFHDYETRMRAPGGFHRPIPARQRVWKTKTGKAEFIVPETLVEDPDMPEAGEGTLRMITLRSNDQFNTTVYGYDDRFRGIKGTRNVVLMNRADMARLSLREGDIVTAATVTARDTITRELPGLRVTPYNIPPGCVGAYYPEANVLLPVWHFAEGSKVPAAKSIPVRIANTGTPNPGWQEIAASRLGRDGSSQSLALKLADEVAVAIRYNTIPYAVMMATPADLEDFATGFTIAEGYGGAQDIHRIATSEETEDSLTLEITLAPKALHHFLAQRRQRNRPAHGGCGICGVQDLASAFRQSPVPALPTRLDPQSALRAIEALREHQVLARLTRGSHAAAWVSEHGEIEQVREDVGRHNALDKLIGARARTTPPPGFCLITSRCSVEMVQKAIAAGIGTLVAISAPTRMAVTLARTAGLTLAAGAHQDSVTIYSEAPAAHRVQAQNPGEAVVPLALGVSSLLGAVAVVVRDKTGGQDYHARPIEVT